MSLVEETRKALLALFPEQAEAGAKAPAAEGEGAAEAAAAEQAAVTSGVVEQEYKATGVHLDVLASPDQVVAAAEILARKGFFLEAVTGVDWIKEKEMEVIYDYNHTGELCRVMVRARIPRDKPHIPTISEIHPGANWHERETHDFFGIKFLDHPCLEPLLLPEDADFHPLLKDFTP